jgi:glycosyltransferase involved in cell wall biosynthesis
MSQVTDRPLRILHAMRTPAGEVMRHIVDLANGQADRGHEVGIIADSLTGGERAEAALSAIAPRLKLGIHRLPINRSLAPADLLTWVKFMQLIQRLRPDVLHGHDAKPGAFMFLQPHREKSIRVYTPHGDPLYYPSGKAGRALYSRVERALMKRTELLLYESAFERDTHQRTIGIPGGSVRCIFNGVTVDAFDPLHIAVNATDLVYVGEFEHSNGADLLIDAVALLHAEGKPVTLTLAGDGEKLESLKAQIERLNLVNSVRFIGHVKARQAFSKGKLLVVPSRRASTPYVVIEAGAAGIPMLAANTGGIPEIVGDHPDMLFAANNVTALADAIKMALENPEDTQAQAKSLRERIFLHFSQKAMIEDVITAYRDALARQAAG